ncbi:MAG: cytochrome c3 family protein [Clostridia bacterium]|nr:cytochrome c3 family protein [Clostridia bacterium]
MTKKPHLLMVLLVTAFVLAMGAVALAKNGLPSTADVHGQMGLECAACHGTGKPGDVSMDVCLECHGSYEELAKATSGTGMNPHDSHYIDLECSLCHHGHTDNEDFCAVCHAPITTADKHMAAGVGCSACHGKSPAKRGEVPMETCLSCHGPYEELAKKTESNPRNPHTSHYEDLDCNVCHHGHSVDEDFCAQCH